MKLPTWSKYRWMELNEREKIHRAWCKKYSKDPDSEEDVNQFFAEMDMVPEEDEDGNVTLREVKPRAKPVPGRAPGRPKKTPQ